MDFSLIDLKEHQSIIKAYSCALAGLIINIIGIIFFVNQFEQITNDIVYLLYFLPLIIGTSIMGIYGSLARIISIGTKISQQLNFLDPKLYITWVYLIIKVEDYYLIYSNQSLLVFIQMKDKTPVDVSLFRKKFWGPKVPHQLTARGEIINTFQKRKIRRAFGIAKVFDKDDNQWVRGEAVQYTVNFKKYPLNSFLRNNQMENLLQFIKSQ